MKRTFPRNIPYSFLLIAIFAIIRTVIWQYTHSIHMAVLVIVALIVVLFMILGYHINGKNEIVGGRKRLSVHRIRKVVEHKWYVSVYYATNVRGRLEAVSYYTYNKKDFIKTIQAINPNVEVL